MRQPKFEHIDNTNVRLTEDYVFWAFDVAIVIPAGYVYDGASIPTWAVSFIGLQRFGVHNPASLIHDYLYENEGNIEGVRKYTRKETDELFRQQLIACKVKEKVANLVYKIVRVLGLIYWLQI
jgi:hypothetical protein